MPQSERHALVVGGGTMGVGIIAMFLGHGWKVDVVSRSAGTRDGLPAACARALTAMGRPADTSALVTHATLPEASWPTIDLVVETVTEDLALKQTLFAEMETLAKPDAALTSNSSISGWRCGRSTGRPAIPSWPPAGAGSSGTRRSRYR